MKSECVVEIDQEGFDRRVSKLEQKAWPIVIELMDHGLGGPRTPPWLVGAEVEVA